MTTSIPRSKSRLSAQMTSKTIERWQRRLLEMQGLSFVPSVWCPIIRFPEVVFQTLCLWRPWLWMRLVRLRLGIISSPSQGITTHFRRSFSLGMTNNVSTIPPLIWSNLTYAYSGPTWAWRSPNPQECLWNPPPQSKCKVSGYTMFVSSYLSLF